MAYVDNTNVSVTTDATALCTAKDSRVSILIQNASASAILYVGTGTDVTASNGTKVEAGESFSDAEGLWKGVWYGIGSATCDVRVMEAYGTKINGVGS